MEKPAERIDQECLTEGGGKGKEDPKVESTLSSLFGTLKENKSFIKHQAEDKPSLGPTMYGRFTQNSYELGALPSPTPTFPSASRYVLVVMIHNYSTDRSPPNLLVSPKETFLTNIVRASEFIFYHPSKSTGLLGSCYEGSD